MLASRNNVMVLCSLLFWSVSNMHGTSASEVFTVLSRYIQQPAQVGEIAPISQKAGLELASFIEQDPTASARHYIEFGGGCGAVSVCLAKMLRPQDHLDVIEIDEKMCQFLRKRLESYPNVDVHCCSILDWHPEYRYDGVISTLPFNSLGVDFTLKTIEYLKTIAKSGCMFSYVEYPIVRQVLHHFYGSKRKTQFLEVQRILKDFRLKHLQKEVVVYFNVPPIAIYHLCLQ